LETDPEIGIKEENTHFLFVAEAEPARTTSVFHSQHILKSGNSSGFNRILKMHHK